MTNLPSVRIPHYDPSRTGDATEDLRRLEDWVNGPLLRAFGSLAAIVGLGTSESQEGTAGEGGEGGGGGDGGNVEPGTVDGQLLRWNDTTQLWEPAGILTLTDGVLLWEALTSSDDILVGMVAGDSEPRIFIRANSQIAAGPGGATPADTFLIRGAVGQWLASETAFLSRRTSAAAAGYSVNVTGEAAVRGHWLIGGPIEFGDGTNPPDTNVYRSAANVLGTDDDFAVMVAGKGLRVKEGSNAKMGTATLVAGTVTVNTTAVTANSRIFVFVQTPGGTQGFLSVANRVAGTSFDILSTDGSETSVVAWILIEPA